MHFTNVVTSTYQSPFVVFSMFIINISRYASIASNSFQLLEYDFVIVGGGSAGCVLANRLTEIGEWNILLLEAGIEEPKFNLVPAFASYLPNTEIDWKFSTQPGKHSCLSYEGGKCLLSQGKVLGGSSSINSLLYVRGNIRDYEKWAELGNTGWGYNEAIHYFKKSEDNQNKEMLESDLKFHGTGGYQSVSHFPFTDRNAEILLEAFKELGYKKIDINAQEQIGVAHLQTTSNHGKRQSTNSAFIKPIRRKRSNLFIKTQAHVTRIIINPSTKEAVGVEYTDTITGISKIVMVRKEVILSAGAINSPKILMLSGVGPASELKKHGIHVIHEAAVGQNFHDHVTTLSFIIKLNKTSSAKTYEERMKDVHYYLKTHEGALSSTGPMICNAFVQTTYQKRDKVPDIQFAFGPVASNSSSIEPLCYFDTIGVYPVLIAPKSRGFIKLNSTDPVWGAPLIYPGYYTNKIDRLRMIDGIRIFQNMFHTKAFKENEYQMANVPRPNCEKWKFNSDKYWTCVITEYTLPAYHVAGSCKMGPKEDPGAVVDSKLQVYGINRLRVVDASIMPIVVHGNTNAPTIMIAEKASDMIKEKWLRRI